MVMGPLVYYCRWQRARLQLQGRDRQWVWGFLVYEDDGSQRSEPFRYDSRARQLYLGEGGDRSPLQLDEMGVVIRDNAG